MAFTLTGFNGKVAVVTGAGRMRSIGRPIALALAQAGCDVVLTGTGRAPGTFPQAEQDVGWRDIESVADEIRALGQRARQVMHGVILVLYAAGLGLAWHYRAALHAPLASSFGILLSLKIILALSILGHFLLVVFLMRNGRMTAPRSRRIHLSVLLHMLVILFLAKAKFLLNL